MAIIKTIIKSRLFLRFIITPFFLKIDWQPVVNRTKLERSP